jgi:hypothetical protein
VKPDLTAHELVRHLANKDSQIGDVAELLKSLQEPTTPKELAEQHSVKRETVHEVTDPLQPWGVERVDNGHRQITTAGEAARRTFGDAVDDIDADDLAWLAWSDNRGNLLKHVHTEGPVTAQETSTVEGLPEKRTVRRTFDEFEERGWVNCEEQNRSRTLVARPTMDCERVADAHDELLTKMEQVIAKAPCLRDLGLECADIPLKALADAEMEEATPEYPFAVEKRARKLATTDFQYFRGLQSHWNGENAKAYLTAVKEGSEFEVVSPPLGLRELPTSPDEVKCVVEGLKAENYQWLMHPDKLPCSLAILDREQVVVGPRDPSTANNTRTGAIFSHNDDLISWALDMYETHRQQSEDPFEVSIGFSIGIEDLIELLRNRYLTEDDEMPDS